MDSDEEENVSEGAKVLMYKSQSQVPDDRRRIRNKYQELIEEAKRERENEEFNVKHIIQNMNQADELFAEVCRPQEAMYDAKLVSIHGEIAKKHAHEIQIGCPFNSFAFIRKLVLDLTGEFSGGEGNLNEAAWVSLGNSVYTKYNQTPKLNFIQGTFVEPPECSRPRRTRQKDSQLKAAEVKVVSSTARKQTSDKTFEEIQRIKKILCKLHRKNGGRPLCYFQFVIDPDSFSRTVENMFHMAFLIKEREVYLSMDDNGLPVIEPVQTDGATGGRTESSQSVLIINVEKWKSLIEVFEISRPSIPPPKENLHL